MIQGNPLANHIGIRGRHDVSIVHSDEHTGCAPGDCRHRTRAQPHHAVGYFRSAGDDDGPVIADRANEARG